MKRKLLTVLCVGMLLLTVIGITACGTHEHKYNKNVVSEASCTQTGVIKYTCECGDSYTKETSTLAHDYSTSEVIAPTCKEQGYTKYTCSCGKFRKDDFVKVIDHQYTETVITLPTCTQMGVSKFTCECGENYTDNKVPKTAHDYKNKEIIAPTCTEQGYTKYSCDCGEYEIKDYVDVVAHQYTETVITLPTCTQMGVSKFTCECGENYTEDISISTKSASEVYNELNMSVGEIITYNKSGSELALGTCFVYTDDGSFITNYHVIEGAYSAKITINGKTYSVSKILAYDKNIDLAVLKISTTGLSNVNICNKEHGVGETVYAIGSSKGLTATFSQGIITYANREIDGVCYVQHDAAISSGNSGGPLVNSYGEVIGINTMTIRDSQNLNFAIMTSELSNLSYSNPLTFSQFYEKENGLTAFDKLKNYIISNGTYDSEDNEYLVKFSVGSWNSTNKYQTMAYYYVDKKQIQLANYIYSLSSSYSTMSFLTIDSLDGYYEWSFIDSSFNYITGNISASSFTSSTILSYTYILGFSGSEYTARRIASQSIYQTLTDMKYDFSSIGVTAKDLGFTYIS